MKTLPNHFYTIPDVATTTTDRKNLKELLTQTEGKIISCGRLRTIKTKHLGAGIYRISLEPLKEAS